VLYHLSFSSARLHISRIFSASPRVCSNACITPRPLPTTATMSLLPLGAALVVLMIDSAIELSFISSMVGYLHRSGANIYPFMLDDGTSAIIAAKPAGLLVNEGHTSNGAAGTALVLICFGGFLALWHQRQRERNVVLISLPYWET
jgi:hypothetical protein